MYDENLEFDNHDEEFSQWLDGISEESDARDEFTYQYFETAKMLAGGAYDVEVAI
jgi:hypothetical protein